MYVINSYIKALDNVSKGHSSLVWYSIDREDQEDESIFFCTKHELLDWTEITNSGTRQNQKNKPKMRQKCQLYYHFFSCT